MAQQTFYLVNSAAGNSTKPSGYLATWTVSNSGAAGANALATAASSNSSTATATSPSGTNSTKGCAQFLSPALAAQTIGAGNWTIGYSLYVSSGLVSHQGRVAIFLVNGSTGAIRSTIAAATTVGASRVAGTGKTVYTASLSGSQVTVTADDYIAIEIGETQSAFSSVTATVQFNGATSISSDSAANTTPASFFTAPASIALSTDTPNAPTSTAASSIAATSLSANWTAPASGANPTGYYLDVATDSGFTSFVSGFNALDVGNVTTKSVTGLTAGTTYYYRVRAYNANGSSSNSSTQSPLTLPPAPTSSAASSITPVGFTANWSSATSATSYTLDVATDSGFTSLVSGYSALNVGNVTSYATHGLSPGIAYWYRIKAVNASGTGAASSSQNPTTTAAYQGYLRSSAALPPNTPSGSTWQGSWSYKNSNATLALGTSAGSAQTSTSGGQREVGANSSVSVGTRRFASAPLAAQTISAGNWTIGIALDSVNITSNHTLGQACYLCVVARDGTTLRGTIFNGLGGAGSLTSSGEKTVYYEQYSGSSVVIQDGDYILLEMGAYLTNYLGTIWNSSMANPSLYYEGATAIMVDATATSDAASRIVAPGTITLLTAPGTPTSSAATNVASTSFSANWSAPGSGGAVLDYRLDVATDSGFTAFVSGFNGLNVGNVTTYSVTGLTGGTIYYYRVRASNDAGASSNSSTQNLTTVLAAPTSSAATSVTGVSFTANWSSSSGATSYRLDVATDSGFTSMVSGFNNLNVGNVVTYSVSPASITLEPNTTYYYRVRAVNTNATSANSSTQNLTTTAVYVGYLRNSAATPPNTPSGATWQGTWTGDSIATKGLSATKGSAQTSLAASTVVSASTTSAIAGGRWASVPLGAQTISAGNWTISFALRNTTSGATHRWRGKASLAVMARDGTTRRGWIFQDQYISASEQSTTVETAVYKKSLSGSSLAISDGDYLLLEAGADLINDDLSLSWDTSFDTYYDGTTVEANGDGSTLGTDSASRIIAPVTVTLLVAPNAPTANAATSITSTSFSANWSAPGAGTSVVGYRLDVATDNGFTSMVVGYNNLDVGNVTTYSVTGLSNLTTYYYRVRSYNDAGTSSNSGTISLATLSGTVTGTIAAAPDVASTSLSGTSIQSIGTIAVASDIYSAALTGWATVSGTIAAAPDVASAALTGESAQVAGTIGAQPDTASVSADGKADFLGTVAVTSDIYSGALIGWSTITGTVAAAPDIANASLSGTSIQSIGTIAAAPELFSAALTGNADFSATIAAAADTASAALTGASVQYIGTVDANPAVFSSVLTGNADFSGTVAAVPDTASTAIAANSIQYIGTMAAVPLAVSASLSGWATITGTIGAVSTDGSAALTGTSTQYTGTIVAVPSVYVASLDGKADFSGTIAASPTSFTAALSASSIQYIGNIGAQADTASANLAGKADFSGTIAATNSTAVASLAGTSVQYIGSIGAASDASTVSLDGWTSISGVVGAAPSIFTAQLSASSTQYIGTIAAANGTTTAALSGWSTVVGDASVLPASPVVSASGWATISGNIAATSTASADLTGVVTINATVGLTPDPASASLSGWATIVGTIAASPTNPDVALSGWTTISGLVQAAPLTAATLISGSTIQNIGDIVASPAGATANIAGGASFQGPIVANADIASASVLGYSPFLGTAALQPDSATVSLAGSTIQYVGDITLQPSNFLVDIAGSSIQHIGTIALYPDNTTVSLVGSSVQYIGTIAAQTDSPSINLIGSSVQYSGTIAAQVGSMTASLSGSSIQYIGTITADAGLVLTAIQGTSTSHSTGSISAAPGIADALLSGSTVQNQGTIGSIQSGLVTASLLGWATITGTISTGNQAGTAELSGKVDFVANATLTPGIFVVQAAGTHDAPVFSGPVSAVAGLASASLTGQYLSRSSGTVAAESGVLAASLLGTVVNHFTNNAPSSTLTIGSFIRTAPTSAILQGTFLSSALAQAVTKGTFTQAAPSSALAQGTFTLSAPATTSAIFTGVIAVGASTVAKGEWTNSITPVAVAMGTFRASAPTVGRSAFVRTIAMVVEALVEAADGTRKVSTQAAIMLAGPVPVTLGRIVRAVNGGGAVSGPVGGGRIARVANGQGTVKGTLGRGRVEKVFSVSGAVRGGGGS